VGFSAGVRAIPASAALGGVIGAAHVLPRRGFEKFEIVVSGYALQCQPRSLIKNAPNLFFCFISKWVSARLDKRCRRLLIDGLESSFLLLRCFFLLIVSCFQQFVIAAYKVGRIHQCSGCCFSEILEGVKIIITLLIGLKIKI
ncbi:hypothetical protein PIB30_042265, partial [Stylosanthes scabra]|nr:hypothetical protein [Stylosanthes scabra]